MKSTIPILLVLGAYLWAGEPLTKDTVHVPDLSAAGNLMMTYSALSTVSTISMPRTISINDGHKTWLKLSPIDDKPWTGNGIETHEIKIESKAEPIITKTADGWTITFKPVAKKP